MSDLNLVLDAPNVGELEKDYLCRAVDSGYVSTAGPFVSEFEAGFADYLKIPHAVSTQSGTAAIHVALHHLGIGPGDEVIVPVLTFIATVNPVRYVGAVPVFVDIDPVTWTLDPAQIESKITDRTKAIIPVHLFGAVCDMTSILAIAQRYGLAVIEDATESLGSTYDGKYTGTLGAFGCFSFNGNKTMTTGGGGMVVGRDQAALDHIKFLVNQARDESVGYYHPEVGFNYRLTNLEAAMGLAQLSRLGDFLVAKAAYYQAYREVFSELDSVSIQGSVAGSTHSRWLTGIRVSGGRDVSAIQSALLSSGIPTRRLFMPLTEHPPYREDRGLYPNAYSVFDEGLCLPSSTLNSVSDTRRAAEIIGDSLR
ncbi:aminotransferase class V-fold PLP-dependent enzyme [bacterium]|nr:aminotransferase class V-fold PLP-dependent enzyme [bacterium]